MNYQRVWITCLCLAIAVQAIPADECGPQKYDNYVFYRTLLLKAEGRAVKFNATRQDFQVEYRQCNADQHAQRMIDFYEGYGFNLADIRLDPFRYHSGNQYELNSISTVGNYRVLMSSLFDYTNLDNSHVYSAWWTLRARTDVNGPKGHLGQNSWLYFGVWRITLHNREFCVYFKSDAPSVRTPEGLEPVDFSLESAEFGRGTGRGLLKIFPDFTLDAREVITFPGENPHHRKN